MTGSARSSVIKGPWSQHHSFSLGTTLTRKKLGSLGIALLLTEKPVFSGDGDTCQRTCYNTRLNKIQLINPRESQFEYSLLVGLWHWKNIALGFF